jgi:D-glycero-D-manno-heptose 1,7-bisphosphate phosphatase
MGVGAVSRPAVFLDRDGVLVEEVFYAETGEWEGPLRPEDVRLTQGAAAALRAFNNSGYVTVLISNQGGYAKGKTTLRSLWLAHKRFVDLLAAEDAKLDNFFYSYGHPDGVVPHFSGPSLDRKPGPYNVLIAAAQLDLDLSKSWMIGDRQSDMACAQLVGIRSILVKSSRSCRSQRSGMRRPSIIDAVRLICDLQSARIPEVQD